MMARVPLFQREHIRVAFLTSAYTQHLLFFFSLAFFFIIIDSFLVLGVFAVVVRYVFLF